MSEKDMNKSIYAALVIVSISPFASIAANEQQELERISVVYRAPLDYAAYQYTIEVISHFNLQLLTDIHYQARKSSMQMAKEQGVITADLTEEQAEDKSLASTRVITSAE